MLPRTPAAGLACLHIKIQISGGCLNGATKERSEFRRTGRLQGSPFLSPISFGDAKEMGSAVGPKPDLLPQTKHTAQTRSSNGPHPRLPPAGECVKCSPHPCPLPQAGERAMQRIVSSLGQAATVLQCTCAISGIAAIKSLVYWCCGSSSTACASPTSTSWPRCMTPMSSHIWRITARLWLMSR